MRRRRRRRRKLSSQDKNDKNQTNDEPAPHHDKFKSVVVKNQATEEKGKTDFLHDKDENGYDIIGPKKRPTPTPFHNLGK